MRFGRMYSDMAPTFLVSFKMWFEVWIFGFSVDSSQLNTKIAPHHKFYNFCYLLCADYVKLKHWRVDGIHQSASSLNFWNRQLTGHIQNQNSLPWQNSFVEIPLLLNCLFEVLVLIWSLRASGRVDPFFALSLESVEIHLTEIRLILEIL